VFQPKLRRGDRKERGEGKQFLPKAPEELLYNSELRMWD
jgi:hypothetical protein